MRARLELRALLFGLAVLVVGLGLGLGGACGRSDLDNPVDPIPFGGTGGGGGTISSTGGQRSGTGGGPFFGTGGQGVGGAGGKMRGTGGEGPTGIPCGAITCDPASQACCAQVGGGTGQPARSCVSAQDPTSCGGVKLGCVDSNSCLAGQVCCLSLLSTSTTCQPALQCAGGTNVTLCFNNSQCPLTPRLCCPLGVPTSGFCVPPGFACSTPGGIPPTWGRLVATTGPGRTQVPDLVDTGPAGP